MYAFTIWTSRSVYSLPPHRVRKNGEDGENKSLSTGNFSFFAHLLCSARLERLPLCVSRQVCRKTKVLKFKRSCAIGRDYTFVRLFFAHGRIKGRDHWRHHCLLSDPHCPRVQHVESSGHHHLWSMAFKAFFQLSKYSCARGASDLTPSVHISEEAESNKFNFTVSRFVVIGLPNLSVDIRFERTLTRISVQFCFCSSEEAKKEIQFRSGKQEMHTESADEEEEVGAGGRKTKTETEDSWKIKFINYQQVFGWHFQPPCHPENRENS